MYTVTGDLYWYCDLTSKVEPYGDLIPQNPLIRIQARQDRDPLTPNLRVDLPQGARTTKITYIEIKTCSGLSVVSQWYSNSRERAVERRVAAIHTEYARHAKEADMRHHGMDSKNSFGQGSRNWVKWVKNLSDKLSSIAQWGFSGSEQIFCLQTQKKKIQFFLLIV